MKMHSLKLPKRTKREMEKTLGPIYEDSGEKYPWGTRVRLDRESLDNLPQSFWDLEVDEEVTITAKAVVIEKRSNERKGSEKPDRSIELQLTSIGMEGSKSFDAGFNGNDEEG